jgi:excisionase family DNA binding protein
LGRLKRSSKMQLLKASHVAELLSVSVARVYAMARQNLLPVVRLGRQVRFDRAQLEEWLRAGGKSLPGGWRKIES